MGGVLEDISVIDLSRFISGPYCAQLLADMGAEVIRVVKWGQICSCFTWKNIVVRSHVKATENTISCGMVSCDE